MKVGDLFTLDPEPYRIALDNASAASQGQVGSRQGGARGEPSPESLPHRHLRRGGG